MVDILQRVDTTAGTGGDGSTGSPWDSWADVQADDPAGAGDTLEVELAGGDDNVVMNVSGLSVDGLITLTPIDDNYRVNRTSSNYSAAVILDGKSVTIDGNYPFRVRQGAAGGRRGMDIGPGTGETVTINKLIMQHEGGGSAFAAVNVDNAGITLIKNSIITTSIADGFNVTFGSGAGNLRLHNDLVNDCAGNGINRAGGTLNAVNCVSGNNTGNDYNGTFASKTDCASEDGTGTTGHTSITWADQFTDFANDDFTLKSGNDLEGNGTDLDSDATLPVTEDIAGTARPATAPAIGPYEPVASGSSGSTTITEGAGVTLSGAGDRSGSTTAGEGEGVSLAGAGNRSGDVTASAGAAVALSGSGDRSGSTTASAGHSVALSGSAGRAGSTTASEGNAVALSGQGDRGGSVTVSGGAGVTLSGSGPDAGASVTVSAGVGVTLEGSADRGGSTSAGAGESVALSGAGNRSGSTTMSAGVGISLSGAAGASGGSVTVSEGPGVTLAGVRSGNAGSTTASAAVQIQLAGSGNRSGSVTVTAAPGVTLSGIAGAPDSVVKISPLAAQYGLDKLTGRSDIDTLSGKVR